MTQGQQNLSMATSERIGELLQASPLFGTLDATAMHACIAAFHEVHFSKNEMIFARGDSAHRLYIVSSGRVRLAIGTSEGRELSYQIVGPGELFGEIGVLDNRGRSAEAVALEITTVFCLERSDFARLRQAHPSASEAVIVYLCDRLRVVSNKLESIALHSLEARLAGFLLMALHGRPDMPGRRTPLELGYSQSELAQLIGASRQKVNTALAALEREGAIKRTADRLFCDRAKLAAMAGDLGADE